MKSSLITLLASLLLGGCLTKNIHNKPTTDVVNDLMTTPSLEGAPVAYPRVETKYLDEAGGEAGDTVLPIPSSYLPPGPYCFPSSVGNIETITDFSSIGEEIGSNILRGETYKYYANFKFAGVPEVPLKRALDYYEKHKSSFKNKNYISIADYSQNSKFERFYLLDMRTGKVTKKKISHGSGSNPPDPTPYGDPDHDGMLDRCVHGNGSHRNMTRPGFFKTNVTYISGQSWPLNSTPGGEQFNGLRLEGLEPRNKEALGSGVVMHEANYNNTNPNLTMGRSYGCPAFAPGEGGEVMNKIKEGSLFYAYAPQCE